MDNKSGGNLLIIQASIDNNRQYSDEKIEKQDSKHENITKMVEKMIDQIQISNFSLYKMYYPKSQDTTTVFPSNKTIRRWKVYIL